METLKLSEIVLSVKPDLYQLLTTQELELSIVLQHGLCSLESEDVLEIIEASIIHNKGTDTLH